MKRKGLERVEFDEGFKTKHRVFRQVHETF